MGYRRSKAEAKSKQQWSRWIEQHWDRLHAIGLPPNVYASEHHWREFLETGVVDARPGESDEFYFRSLARNQMRDLWEFLRAFPQFDADRSSLIGFLAVHLEDPAS